MDDAKKDLFWVVIILLALAVVWFYTGGPARPSATNSPFLKKPLQKHQTEIQKQSQKIIGNVSSHEKKPSEASEESAYKYKVILHAGYAARKSDPQKEYVEIRASSNNKKPLLATGWTLEGKKGLDIKIGEGAYLPYSARVNPQQAIFLQPGAKAYIITGESPIGTSFQLNKCTGYFAQFQNFTPYLSKQCPYPKDEDLPENLSDKCLDYIDRLPRCEIPLKIPWGLPSSCGSYIAQKINYNSCVKLHKNDPDFYKPEWRIYLGRGDELWKKERETIVLKDQNGKIIDWSSY